MQLTLILVMALVLAVLAFFVGQLTARARRTTASQSATNELQVLRSQLGTLEAERNRARSEAQRLVLEERTAGADRLALAQQAADGNVARVEERWESQVNRQQAEFTERLNQERADAEERGKLRDQEFQERHSEAQQRAERVLAEERQRHADELAAVKALGDKLLADERQRAGEQLEQLRADQKRIADEFETLSRRALEVNSRQFLEQADERFKRSQDANKVALEQRELAVKQLVDPIAQSLDSVKAEVTNAEKARGEANAALTEQLATMRRSSEQLSSETRQLVTALRAPQVRGRWGELQLRRVVEASGMVNHVDFAEQESVNVDGGLVRPDMIVRIVGGKQVVVDSKVAFSGYLEALEAQDERIRAERLTAHARHLRKHIDDLGAKAYWDSVDGTPEFVVMFVPAEPFLAAALDEDPSLFEHAFERNVIIATPSTLIALLRTVGHVWKQERLAGEAKQIHDAGRELHKRLGTLGSHLTKLSKKINETVSAYNAFAGSLDRSLVTQARRFSGLQGVPDPIEAPMIIETAAVPPQKPELYSEKAEDDAREGSPALSAPTD